ncbi:MAG: c-type cytochrome [Thiotrichales bacterium]
MLRLVSVCLAVLALAVSVPAVAQGDKAAGKEKAAVCAGCHGLDGNSANPEWPKLAGQSEAYIVKQLQDFKSKARDNAVMYPQAAALSDQDMADLGAFYAAQAISAGAAEEAVIALGESVYRGGNSATGIPACIGCHAPNGVGNPAAKFPRLSGQHATYTASQLKTFRSGLRANDAGKMMRMVAQRLTDAEVDAVSQYVSGLK